MVADNQKERPEGSAQPLTRRRFILLSAGALAGIPALLTACQQAAPAPPSKPAAAPTAAPAAAAAPAKTGAKTVLKFGHVLATTEPIHLAAVEWGKRVSERTNGEIEIQVYPNSTLGNNRDTYEMVLTGAPVLAHADPGYMQDYVPDFGILNGPFLVDDPKDFTKVLNSDWFAEIKASLEKKDLPVINFNWYFGQRHIISDRARPNPDALRGVKFRVPPNIMWEKTIAAMGGTPTPLQWSEVYSGLAQGVVNAAEAPLSTLYGSKLYEVAKVVTLTGHFKALTGIVGGKFYQSLPEAQRKIIEEECAKAGEQATAGSVDLEQDWRSKMEAAGTKFENADVAAFKKATAVVYTQFPAWTPGLYDRIMKIIGS
jgi:TRAP-type transport system periplasmic protein